MHLIRYVLWALERRWHYPGIGSRIAILAHSRKGVDTRTLTKYYPSRPVGRLPETSNPFRKLRQHEVTQIGGHFTNLTAPEVGPDGTVAFAGGIEGGTRFRFKARGKEHESEVTALEPGRVCFFWKRPAREPGGVGKEVGLEL